MSTATNRTRQTGHYIYEWPDQPHEPVTLMRVRARITEPAPGNVQPDIPPWNRLGHGNNAIDVIYVDRRQVLQEGCRVSVAFVSTCLTSRVRTARPAG